MGPIGKEFQFEGFFHREGGVSVRPSYNDHVGKNELKLFNDKFYLEHLLEIKMLGLFSPP